MGSFLSLFIPDSSSEDIAVIGRTNSFPEELVGVEEPELRRSGEVPASVVWFIDDRPKVGSPNLDLVRDCLRVGGKIFLIGHPGLLRGSRSMDVSSFIGEEKDFTSTTYALDGTRLVRTDRLDTPSLPDTSKASLVRRALRRILPFRDFWKRRTVDWNVTVVSSGSSPSSLPIEKVASLVGGRGGERLGINDIVWIDRTQMNVALAQIATPAGDRYAIEAALDGRAECRLLREIRNLSRLASSGRVAPEVRNSLPRILGLGSIQDRRYLVTRWMDGIPGSLLMYSPRRRRRAVDVALRWVTRLHQKSLGPPLDPSEASARAERVLAGVATRAGSRDRPFEREIRGYLETSLARSPLPAVLGHGDFWLGNIKFDPSIQAVAGVFDWDHTDFAAPPLEDVLHLLFFQKGVFSQYHPCRRLGRLLAGRAPQRIKRSIGTYWSRMDLDPRMLGTAVILYWLRFLDRREHQFSRRDEWYEENYLSIHNLLRDRSSEMLDTVGPRILKAMEGNA